jgi:hypothetical protein
MKIADSIRQLMAIFRNIRFDYMVIPNYNSALEDVIPQDSKLIYTKKGNVIQ